MLRLYYLSIDQMIVVQGDGDDKDGDDKDGDQEIVL